MAHDPANSVVEMKQTGIDAGNSTPELDGTDPATANEVMSWVSAKPAR